MRIQLVTYKGYTGHVAQEVVNEFQQVIISNGVEVESTSNLTRIVSLAIIRKTPRLVSWIPHIRRKDVKRFSIIIGPEFQKCLLAFLNSGNNSVYIFDAWPEVQATTEALFRSTGVKHAFFSSRYTAELFATKGLDCKTTWVPEGVTMANYRFNDYAAKDISVLAFGRRYEDYHKLIVDRLAWEEITYLYQKAPKEIVFPTRDKFVDGLARTKISICVPSSITHPEKAGKISTMTTRYLQSMASKCLIVGHMPEEMKTLFDYTPIIEIDWKDPAGQLTGILKNFESYIPLIEKNYTYVLDHHTWEHRWQTIRTLL